MSEKLWSKGQEPLSEIIAKYEVGWDNILDTRLISYDIFGTLAHVRMLTKLNIISDDEYKNIARELSKVYTAGQNNKIKISIEQEDIHTVIENILTEKLGDTGKRIHTARSRNDQVMTTMRLYSKDNLIDVILAAVDLARAFLIFAGDYKDVPMPGYTHTQQAMPSSVGMWALSFCEGILDELTLGASVFQFIDANPLGSGAGYGVPLEVDRHYTARLLEFERVQINPIYCSNSRGKFESVIIGFLTGLYFHLNKFATDLINFTTQEFRFFKVNETVTTGSSLMPQKKNLDPMELVRGRYSLMLGLEMQVKSLISSLPSGYNRDYQDTKKSLIEAFEIILPSIAVCKNVLENITPDKERLLQAHHRTIFATDYVLKLVSEKAIPFREAYKMVGQNLDSIPDMDAVQLLETRTHIGATGNLQMENYHGRIKRKLLFWSEVREAFHSTLKSLFPSADRSRIKSIP